MTLVAPPIKASSPQPLAVSKAPATFVRILITGPGWPWEQGRRATRDALDQAPIALPDLVIQLRRRGLWRPGVNGQFVACYGRKEEVGRGLDVRADLGEEELLFQLRAPGDRRAAEGRRMLWMGIGAAAVCVMLIAIALAGQRRELLSARLAALEVHAEASDHRAANARTFADQSRRLVNAGVDGRSAAHLLNDLAWASSARRPGSEIDLFHWEGGLFGIAAVGDAPPLDARGRTLVKAERPAKGGLSIWGVTAVQPSLRTLGVGAAR